MVRSLDTPASRQLKRHNQAKIIKKSLILFWFLINMSIICEHVHGLELRRFLKLCVAHLPVRREIRTKFNFGHVCPK